ncbi:SDR family NAD(P)-dependent oxidoreductase [Bacteroidota bacterium]
MNNYKALVSGGSKGIGKAIALRLAENDMDICITGRNVDDLNEVKEEIEKLGRKCDIIVADFNNMNEVREAGKKALQISPVWNILVNNAGTISQDALIDIKEEDWDNIMNVNLKAALILSQIIVPQMIERKQGKVINISSLGAFVGTIGLGAYAASKAALSQLTRTMATEWGPHNIQANAICPTLILTKLSRKVFDKPENQEMRQNFLNKIPAGRFGELNDAAGLALFLASKDSDFINGVSIPLDGGKLVG